MCISCSIGIPACAIDGTCTAPLIQNLKLISLTATPMFIGSAVWVKTKLGVEKKPSEKTKPKKAS